MPERGLSRRQFVKGAAATAAAVSASGLSATTAGATPVLAMPIVDFAPLDPKATARLAWEIYKGGNAPLQAG